MINMGLYLTISGIAIICYTLVAYCFSLPQLSEFLPVVYFGEKTEGQYYRIVPAENPDQEPWPMIGLGTFFVLLGLLIKYVSKN